MGKGKIISDMDSITSARIIGKKAIDADLLVRSMKDLIFFLDKDGVVTNVLVPEQEELLFLSPKLFIDKQFDALGLPENLVDHTRLAFDLARAKKSIPTVNYSLTLDNRQTWFNASYSPQYGNGGTLTGMTVVARNMTGQVRLEERARKSELKYQALINNLGGVVYSAR